MGSKAVEFFFRVLISAVGVLPSQAFGSNESPQTFTLDGQLFQSGTTSPLLDSNATVKVQIINPNGTCLLYEEQQTVNTTTSSGWFHLNVGSAAGAAKRTVNDPGRTMTQIFQNLSPISANDVPGQTCAGSIYSPSAGAIRYFRITVTPSTTGVDDTLTPDIAIDSVPMAMVAQSVQGLERGNILQVSNSGPTALTQGNLEALFTTPAYANLQAILSGNFIKTDASGAALPSYAADPAGVSNGDIWFDSTTGELKFKNTSGVQTVAAASGGGPISSLTVGSSMSINGSVAGTISSGTATIDLSDTGVLSGTYTKVTVDPKGRVTAGTVSLVEADIPDLTAAGKVSGNTMTSGTISGSTSINTSGHLISTGTVSGLTVQATNLRVYNGANYVQLAAPALSGNVNLTLPATDGNNGEFLKTDGNGILSWATASVTSTDVTTALGYTPLNAASSFSGDVSGLYNATSVDKIKGKSVTAATTSGQVMIYNGTSWVNSVVSGDGTLAYDGILTLNKVPVSKGGTNSTSFGNNRIIASNGTGTALQDFTCSLNQVISFDASGNATCSNVSSLAGTILNGGNSTGADISIGTNDNKAFSFKTNNSIAMTISQNGDVGFGTSPGYSFHVRKDIQYYTDAGGGPYLYLTQGKVAVASSATPVATLYVGGNAVVGNAYSAVLPPADGLLVQGLVGVGVTSPSSSLDISGAFTAQGMSSTPSVSSANTGRIYYDYSANKFKVSQNGAAYVDLIASGGGGITSFGGQTGSAQSLAISVDNSVATPTITSASDTHTWKIPMASNVGTTAGLLSKTDYDSFAAKLGTATIFAGDVSGSYNSTVVQKIQGKAVTAASVSGQMMIYNGTSWVNSVLSGDATLASDGMLTLNKVPVSKGGTNSASFGGNRIIASNGTGSALVDFTCSLNQVVSFDASGNATCANVSSLSGSILNGGNSTGADISIGTNDNKALNFKVNNSTIAMTISQNGNVGIGTTAPATSLHVVKNSALAWGALGAGITADYYANGTGDAQGASIYLRGSRGSFTTPAAVQSGDTLGGTGFGGYDGTAFSEYQSSPGVTAVTTQNWSSTAHGSALDFWTNANNSTALTRRMRIDQNGYVGIGITSPSTALDVSGAINLIGMSSTPALSLSNQGRIYYDVSSNKFKVSQNGAAYVDLVSSAASAILNGGNTTGADISIGTNDNKALNFKVNNSTIAMTISQGGNVGIGTTPGYGFHVKKNTQYYTDGSGNPFLYLTGNSVGVRTSATPGSSLSVDGNASIGSSYVSISTGPTNGLIVQGSVGFGLTSPTTALDISGAITAQGMSSAPSVSSSNTGRIYYDFSANKFKVSQNGGAYVDLVSAGATGILNGGNTTGADISIGTNDNKALSFKVNNSTIAMTISQGGSIGIGTSSPSSVSKLHIAGDGNALFMTPSTNTNGVAAYMLNNGNGSLFGIESSAGGTLILGSSPYASVFGTQSTRSFQIGTNNAVRMTIDSAGLVGIGTSTPSEKLEVSGNIKAVELILSSDRNLKRDIQPLENSLQKILSLAGVKYHWRCEEYPERNFDHIEHMGLIAQEVAKVYPELVHGKDGNLAVDYVGLVAPMIEAIKEQHSQVRSLQDEVSRLKELNSKQQSLLMMLMKRVDALEKK